jgi:hypothetical protein
MKGKYIMGTIETFIDKEANLTIQTVNGIISGKEIMNAIDNYYNEISTKLILWDFTNADLKGIDSKDVKEIVYLTKKYAKLRLNGKTAMVFSSDFDFGMGRMYEIKQEVTSPEIVLHRSFKNRNEALTWLKEY